jgi:hypothetical protein
MDGLEPMAGLVPRKAAPTTAVFTQSDCILGNHTHVYSLTFVLITLRRILLERLTDA